MASGAYGPELWAQQTEEQLGSEPPTSREFSLSEALGEPAVQGALSRLEQSREQAAELLTEIGRIISPSGQEQDRARAVADVMRTIGMQEVRVDSIYNAIGVIPGTSDSAVVFVSTLDDLTTVAKHQRAAERPPHIEGDRVVGPGSNTSSTTVALLTAAKSFLKADLKPEHSLVFAAVAQEETGLGGMRVLYERYQDQAVGFVDVLGDGRSISYGALGIHWWKVYARGQGGHTLGGGLPNVNQGIGKAVDRILQLSQTNQYPGQSALNVSIISSGTVFNHKPEQGWFSLDVRSGSSNILAKMEQDIREDLAGVSEETEIDFEMEPVMQIPSGQIGGMKRSDLVSTSANIARHLGLKPTLDSLGSSNMNIAIAGGTPAIGLGGNRGGERGKAGEWADIPTMIRSAKHVLLLAVTMGGLRSLN